MKCILNVALQPDKTERYRVLNVGNQHTAVTFVVLITEEIEIHMYIETGNFSPFKTVRQQYNRKNLGRCVNISGHLFLRKTNIFLVTGTCVFRFFASTVY